MLLSLLVSSLLLAANIFAEEKPSYDGRALSAYLRGSFLESTGNLYEAYRSYLYASAIDPKNARIMLRLARIAAQIGDYEKSKEYADSLLVFEEYSTEARMILAEVEYRLGHLDRSMELLDELSKDSDAPRFEVLVFYGRVAAEAGKTERARKAFEEAVKENAGDDSAWYDLGLLRARMGEREAAISAFSRAVELNPDHEGAHLELARFYESTGRDSESVAEYREVLRIDSFSRSAVKELSDLLYKIEDYEGGAKLLEPFFRDGYLDEGGELVYARFLYKAGRTEDAIAVLSKMTSAQARPQILRLMIEMEIERGLLKSAMRHIERLLSIEPDRFENYTGALLLLYGRPSEPASPEEALDLSEAEKRKFVDKAAKLVPRDSAEGNHLVGSLLRRLGDFERAIGFLLAAEKLAPDDESITIEVASAYARLKQFDDALKRVIPLYNRNSEDASLANFYGYLLAEKGENLDLAEKLISKALEKEPENGYYLDSLGWVLYKKGDIRSALEILLSASRKTGDDPIIWEHVGDAYLRLEELEKAREAFGRSLEIDPSSNSVRKKLEELGEK